MKGGRLFLSLILCGSVIVAPLPGRAEPPRTAGEQVSVQPSFVEIARYFEQFLDQHPSYQGRDNPGIAEVYRNVALGVQPCNASRVLTDEDWRYLRSLTYEKTGLSRGQLRRLIDDFSEPRNFVEGHYAGEFSGYRAGDHWAVKTTIIPGTHFHTLNGQTPRPCSYGWLAPNEKPRVIRGQ